MIFFLLFIPITVILTLETEIFIDLSAQISNSISDGSQAFPYSNLTEAVQSQNFSGNNNISNIVFILVKNETSYEFFDELTLNFNLTIKAEFTKYNL